MARMLTVALVVVVVLAGAREVPAQEWNDARTRALVELATARRAQQLADTGLADYQARAHGYLTFLAQLGDPELGFLEPPRVVKADEIAVEVYWRAPNLSKQRIVGRRDTLLLPTDQVYHRDHLGIVQNNFPDIIRLGDGDEVRDVPHPLSTGGLAAYDFRISDSLRIRLPDRRVEVYEVKVRPTDDRQARVIGAVYIDREGGQVVRMAFTFTRAAFLDRQLDDLSVVLENALIGGRFWLPSRQEIEIRRSGTWLDVPARGIIRGRWEVCCYALNVGLDAGLFQGPEIVQATPAERAAHQWQGRILDSLPPDVRAVTDDEVRLVQEEARALVRAQALARVRRPTLSARGASDFVQVNRVEGVAVGAGVTPRLGHGVSFALAGRYGFADRAGKGRAALGWERPDGVGVRLLAFNDHREAWDEVETSRLRNSLAAQEFGSDYTNRYLVRGGGIAVDAGRRLGVRWRLQGTRERQDALAVHATPASGAYEPTIAAWSLRTTRVVLGITRPTSLAPLGTEMRLEAELRGGWHRRTDTVPATSRPRVLRAAMVAHVERPFGVSQRLVLHTVAAMVSGRPAVPPQDLVYLGGPTTGAGYDFHAFVGRAGASQRVEWRTPIPFLSIPLGRFGRAPGSATLAPFAQGVWIDPGTGATDAREGFFPAAGVGALMLFDLVRMDIARGLRDGRWTVSVDVAREFWGLL